MKICSICKLPEKQFHKNKSRADGLQTYCKECAKARSSARYRNFSEKELDKRRQADLDKRTRNKQFLWNYLKLHPCIDCGEHDPIVLEFDHVQEGKLNSVSNLANNGTSLNKLEAEINKCEVRCANCHRRKTAKQLNWYENIGR